MHSFQNSCVIDTGLSDFHEMTVTLMYQDYKNFSNNELRLIINTKNRKFAEF